MIRRLPVNDRKRQKPVENKKLAGLQDGGGFRQGYDFGNHDFPDHRFRQRRQKPARRHNSNQFSVGVHSVEINHPFPHAFAPDF